jgi:hypothetical protein
MDGLIPERISLSDFLNWENQQSERYEWLDGAVVVSHREFITNAADDN